MSPGRVSPLLITKDNHSNLKSSLFDSSFSTYVVEKSENVLHLKDFEEESPDNYEENGLDLLGDSDKMEPDHKKNIKKSFFNDAKTNQFGENVKQNTCIEPENASGLPNKPLSPILQFHD